MSGKLDQSLDQIMKDTKPGSGRGRRARPGRRAAVKAKAAIAAPAGGVQKNTRAPAKANKATAAAPVAPATGESKIIVSNLPEDVTETQIKDYFGKTIGQVKRVTLTYGPTGRSRGVATIIFNNPTSGAQAAKQLDGVKVDNRAMRIEVVLGAKQAPTLPAPKSLADRMSQPKNAAKVKVQEKTTAGNKTNGVSQVKSGRGKKPARAGRPKKKTAEELDAEMTDYFGGDGNAANGTAQPAAATNGGDAGMIDEVM